VRANHRKLPLSRHLTISSRSITVAIITASALTGAAVPAATWTSGPAGSAAGGTPQARGADAGPLLTVTEQLAWPQGVQPTAGHYSAALQASAAVRASAAVKASVAQSSADSQAWQTSRLRDVAAQLTAAHWAAAQAQAARKAQAMAPAQPAATAQATPQATATVQATKPASVADAQVATSGSPQQIAAAMLASFGWSSGQLGCLDPLWEHESGWSVTADNAGTGAYGIPQALPGSRMSSAGPDWQTSAQTQIKWGLEYIKDTYGSPCGAWDHEEATGWY
jgi:hypothetical protein